MLAIASLPLLLSPKWGYGIQWDTLAATIAMLTCWALAILSAHAKLDEQVEHEEANEPS